MDQQITDLTGMARLAETELAKQVYADGLQEGTAEIGKLFFELSKTTRMVFQPMFTALQGASSRLNDWVEEAVSQIPPENRVSADPKLLRSVVQAIGVEEDESSLRGFYVKLLVLQRN